MRIKVLPENITNKIAAGEIIERPVSIVKELVENSIDAESKKIVIVVEKGGKNKIQIIDDGVGMAEEDALLAFERHATSKIRNVEDIVNISSLGFRGEALPSIASVSKTTLLTKDENSATATEITVEFGKILNVRQTSANTGTDISITHLFNNLPARKKFLKTDQVELKHIVNYIHYQALAFPDIHFRLINNGQERLNYPAVRDKVNRFSAVLGNDFLQSDFVNITNKNRDIKLSGYISGLEESNSPLMDLRYIFINGRYIKDRIVSHSINSAYDPFIKKFRIYQQGKLPPYLLFININPELIDFNVHPAKQEIRFRDPHQVHSFIKLTITDALLEYQDRKFRIARDKLTSTSDEGRPSGFEQKAFAKQESKKETKQMKSILNELYQPNLFKEEKESEGKPVQLPQFEHKAVPSDLFLPKEEDMVNPWQLHNSYIIVNSEDGMIIIDQHAAHERILYEKFFHRLCGVPAITQPLLFPIIVDIPPIFRQTISEILEKSEDMWKQVGFSLKTFSNDSVVIDEIPAELSDWDGGEVFKEILAQLQEEYKQTQDYRDSIAKAVSCKAAVKAGERLGKREMLQLINDLFACQIPYYCPHGRPVLIKQTLHDLERQFKRI